MDKGLCEHVHEFLDLELYEVTLLLCGDKIALYRVLRAHHAQHRHQNHNTVDFRSTAARHICSSMRTLDM